MNQVEKRVISELGLEKLTEEEKQQLITQITEVLNGRVIQRLHAHLGPQDQNTLQEYIDQKNTEAVWQMLQEHTDNLDQIITEELQRLMEELKKDVQDFKAQAKEELSSEGE
ncbi:MAG: DUF5663 domain-containing protein [Candidatus Paceibacteria bacterium]